MVTLRKQVETANTKTQTRMVLNAAFLQEIKDSNPDYWQAIHQVRQVCQSDEDKRQVSSKLVELLDSLRDNVAMQFALEECYGYVDLPDPSLAGNSSFSCDADDEFVHAVRGEHCSLYLELSVLAERAEEYQYRGIGVSQVDELLEQTRQFDARLQEHERVENELIDRSLGST
ncbi:hypothetical protein Q31b_29950 [Novipirellula aureliae]|uniref:Uncharacterized protein n=1 Tax=Novipirellula aureliae TaxID=2527966 RepID=A0A5C6E2E2_9BACT|nr:hypothetical protein [Novipirellula aureliae]TWU41546.1 hypothetical protein Q31b_29950 [Novipirellula aureliae]